MSKPTLVDYTNTSSDEEDQHVKISPIFVDSTRKKVAIVQPTIVSGNDSENQSVPTPTYEPSPPANSPVSQENGGSGQNADDTLEDVAHILLDLSNQPRNINFERGDMSPFIEITSSPLQDPNEPEIIDEDNGECEIIDISSDSSATILHNATPPSQRIEEFGSSQPEVGNVSTEEPEPEMYDQFDDYIISDRSFTTG